jgi:hypothetical protein
MRNLKPVLHYRLFIWFTNSRQTIATLRQGVSCSSCVPRNPGVYYQAEIGLSLVSIKLPSALVCLNSSLTVYERQVIIRLPVSSNSDRICTTFCLS